MIWMRLSCLSIWGRYMCGSEIIILWISSIIYLLFFFRFLRQTVRYCFKFDELKKSDFLATANLSYTLVYATLGNLSITQPFSVMIISRLAEKGY